MKYMMVSLPWGTGAASAAAAGASWARAGDVKASVLVASVRVIDRLAVMRSFPVVARDCG